MINADFIELTVFNLRRERGVKFRDQVKYLNRYKIYIISNTISFIMQVKVQSSVYFIRYESHRMIHEYSLLYQTDLKKKLNENQMPKMNLFQN